MNLVYLVGVISAAALSSRFGWPPVTRDLIILGMAFLSWFTTGKPDPPCKSFGFTHWLKLRQSFWVSLSL